MQEVRRKEKLNTAKHFGFNQIQMTPDETGRGATCEVYGCPSSAYIVVFYGAQGRGLFICKHHYGFCKFLEDSNTQFNDYLGVLK